MTPTKLRVLKWLESRFPAWILEIDIDQSRELKDDDVVVLPALLEDGLIDYCEHGMYRINDRGRAALLEDN